MFTGSASSVVGPRPSKSRDFLYSDITRWADYKQVTKPNEHVKLMSERYLTNKISKLQKENPGSGLSFTSILPYFMVGPPLYPDVVRTNASCQAIS